MKSIVLGPGESRAIDGRQARIKASSEDCDERFCVLESVVGLGDGPGLHVHRRHLEAFSVLVAPGTVHRFSNPGKRPCRFLGIVSPGGFERYFREVNEALGDGPPDPAVMRELMSNYDIVSV